jgi:hypothetical protein
MGNKNRLFIGVFSTGLSYCDRTKEKDGDYLKVAFFPYDTLKLQFYVKCDPELREMIEQDAATMKPGTTFQISSCGQMMTLGRRRQSCSENSHGSATV